MIFLFILFFTIDAFAMNRKHSPFANGQCLICHQKGADGQPVSDAFVDAQPDMCYKCHDRKDKGPVVHPAMEQADCTTCHSPHESTVRPLLKDTIENTCTMCHDAPGREFPIKHSALKMTKSCVRCHNAHSSERPKLLKAETTQLCVYCHTEMGKALAVATNTIHPALQKGCQSCHSPHGSKNEKLLKENPNGLCFTCHDKAKFDGGHPQAGHPLSGVKDPLHPEKDFTCISCHRPHFSPNKKLFRYNYNKAPYNGSLCTVCHWKQILPPPGPPTPDWNE
jgi:predicted CXXCH cytochrome family protein